MSTAVSAPRPTAPTGLRPGLPFALAALGVAGLSAFLAGWLPLAFSVVTVFLFAGPHNWLELRYFMGRMPGRWGRLRSYFLVAFAGIIILSAVSVWFTVLYDTPTWTFDFSFHASAIWNTALVLWVAGLVQMRSRQNPRRDWSWIWPVSFLLIALTWLDPFLWHMGIVYGHPLVALWVLDRELKRSRPRWRPAYHCALLAVPLVLGLLWWRLADAPRLPGTDMMTRAMTRSLTMQISDNAGSFLINGVSNHFLVAAHTFLEMLHYGVWVIVIPLVAYRTRPWKLDVPLARRSLNWKCGLLALLAVGVLVMALLWGAFLIDYPWTRNVYFTVAIVHVLAEIPFLLRAL